MIERPPISEADLVRALKSLAPSDEATRRAIVEALGFHLHAAGAPKSKTPSKEKTASTRAAKPQLPNIIPTEDEQPDFARERQFRLTQTHSGEGAELSRLVAPAGVEPLPAGAPEDSLPPPPFEPLFNPQWSRALVSTLARIRTRTGPPDIERMVELAVERQPVLSLPSCISETASGADVLVDSGDSMGIFARDQERLVSLIRKVLGVGHVAVFQFAGCPGKVMARGSFEEVPYAPPQPGWPVVALTDLGIPGIGGTLAWRSFAESIWAAGCHPIALVPYPPARWPAGLADVIDIVQWDRLTSVRTVRATLRASRRLTL